MVVTSNRNIVAVGRPHLGAAVTTYNGFAGGSTTFYVPMLFKNMFGSYDSALYVQNISPSNTATITIKFYDTHGILTYTQTDTIPPVSSQGYWLPYLSCLGSSWQGSVKVESNQPVVAVGRPHLAGMSLRMMALREGIPRCTCRCSSRRCGAIYNSALTWRISANNPANVTINFYDVNGNLSCVRNDTIPALGVLGLLAAQPHLLTVGGKRMCSLARQKG